MAQWLRLLVAPGQVTELRAIRHDKGIDAGFYDSTHLEDMARVAALLSADGSYKGIYLTFNPVNPALLQRAPNSIRKLGKGEAATDADILTRRWLLIDVDPRRPGTCSATDVEKAKANATIIRVRDHLQEQGWAEPLMADSGNGYHLLYRVALPGDDGGLIKAVLGALADRFDDEGAEVDRKVFNPSRITKLYGTKARKGDDTAERPHRWTRVIEIPDDLRAVPEPLLERLAAQAPAKLVAAPRAEGPTPGPDGLPVRDATTAEKQALARSYLAKVPGAVEGQGGDKQTYTVACRLTVGFDLTVEDALPLLLEYNQRCEPPWTDDELRRKLDYASREPGERGALLRGQGEGRPGPRQQPAQAPAPVPGGHPFLGVVPDFVMWDATLARPTPQVPRKDSRGRPNKQHTVSREWMIDILRYGLIVQRRLPVVVPDVFIAQLVWGPRESGRWPRNWRRTILSRWRPPPEPKPGDEGLSRQEKARRTREANKGREGPGQRRCSDPCPLSGLTGVPHLHFRWSLSKDDLGVMGRFAREGAEGEGRTFDFRNGMTLEEVEARKEELTEEIRGARRFLSEVRECSPGQVEEAEGRLRELQAESRRLRPGARKVDGVYAIYLPVRIFGPSPLSGLTPPQCKLLSALTMELTRTRTKTDRPDKAQVVRGGAGRGQPREQDVPACPFLEKNAEYVVFGGNGRGKNRRLHGYGFRLSTWMEKAGYPEPCEYSVTFTDLTRLRQPFGLIVAGWNRTAREWKTLDEMVALRRTKRGQEWLDGCVVRVYTKADYLQRWRRYFAERLGFSSIPDGGEEVATPSAAATPGQQALIQSAQDLQVWMRQEGLTDGQLAARLGVSRTSVNLYRTGARAWSAKFAGKVNTYLMLGSV
jgi:hypothetical protein